MIGHLAARRLWGLGRLPSASRLLLVHYLRFLCLLLRKFNVLKFYVGTFTDIRYDSYLQYLYQVLVS